VSPRRVSEEMARSTAAEVVVRFAETTVTLAHVAPRETFVVGRHARAQLPFDVPAFTLVASTEHGFVVCAEAGAQPIALDHPVELSFGQHVTIRVSLVTHEHAPVPRTQIERRPFTFGLGSLLVHVALLLVATWLATPDEETVPANETMKRRPARIARFAVAAQTVKREPKPAPDETPITADETPSPNPATDDAAAAAAAAVASTQMPNGHGEKVPSTVESAPSDDETQEGRRFDPDANAAFDTVKVGKYTTVSTGSSAGASFRLAGENGQRKPLVIVSCDSSSCVVIGGDPESGIREALEAKLDEIVACYEKHASTAGKKVELDFGIDESGKVDAVNVGGVGDYDSCVADIIKNLTVEK
jgi:hypothetical protein